jgi:hypothetical protein
MPDHRSDLWSLAATFYQMLTGKSPKVINIASLPPKLQSVVAKALDESKEDRFQSVHEMREKILQAHSGKMDNSRTLAEGECPQCATPNPPHGKFCNECSAILQVQCLKCKVEIQIWNKACGDCGAQQAPLEVSLRQTLDGLKDRAQELSEEMNFSDAKDAANEILAQQHPRLLDHHDWARSFIDTTQVEEQRLTEFANARYREAKQHRKSFDYDAATQAIKSIHSTFMTAEMVQWNHTLNEDKTQGEELYAEIKTLLASEQYAGLLSKVDRLIELRGPKDSLTTLKGKLIKREASIEKQRDGIRLEAQGLFFAGDLTAATRVLKRIPMERRNDEDLHLAQQLAIASPILDQIREFVSQSKSNFDTFSSSVPRFLTLVVRYLEVVPKHDQINQLKKGLIKRISENYQNYYTRETDVGFSDIPAEIRLLIPSELLNTYIKNQDDVKVFVRRLVDLLVDRQKKIAEEAHESGEPTLEFTITDDQIENQRLTAKVTVRNRSPYDVHQLRAELAVLKGKRGLGVSLLQLTHLEPAGSHTWDNITTKQLDSDDYDGFGISPHEFYEAITKIKDQNGKELPNDNVQMKISYNSV